jgi:hypothetical protein
MPKWLLCILMGVAIACADPSGPNTHLHPQRLLVPGTEEGAVIVDLDWRGIIRRSGPRYVSQGPTALNLRGEVITAGRLESDATVIAGVDIRSGLELWRFAVAQGNTALPVNGVDLGATMMAANPTRPEIFLWRSVQNGVAGVAGYDYQEQRITRFIGPIGNRLRAIATLPSSSARRNGCLVLALDSGNQQSFRAFLHVVCGNTYAERDSVAIGLPSRIVRQMEIGPDGRELLVMTDLELLKLDVGTLQVTARADRPLDAPFFVSRATGRLIIPDVGSSLVASTGIIYVLNPALELASIIDLRVLPFGERPLGILGAEESRDGKWLYIMGGVPPDRGPFSIQATHLLVIDNSTGMVVDTIHLDTYGGNRVLLVP